MKWKETLVTIARSPYILVALAGCAILFWLRYAPPTAPWSPQKLIGMRMLEPERITKIEKVIVPGPPQIKIVPKESVRIIYRDLPTPPTIEDNNAWVTAVCDIPPSPQGGTAVSVLTGTDNVAVGHIEYKAKPVPFFQVKRELGIRGGYGTEGIIGELYVHPLRIGPMDLEGRVYGRSGNNDSEVGAAVLVDFRF